MTERGLGVSWRPRAAVRGRQGLILGGDGFCAQMQTEAEAGYEESKRGHQEPAGPEVNEWRAADREGKTAAPLPAWCPE